MRLDFLVLADAAQVQDRGKVSMLGAGITRIDPPQLPLMIPKLALVVRLLVEDADLGVERTFHARWLDPDAEAVVAFQGSIEVGDERLETGEEQAVVLVTEFALPLRKAGIHTVDFAIDDVRMASRTVVVVLAQPVADEDMADPQVN